MTNDKLQFIDYCKPKLESGEYKIEISHNQSATIQFSHLIPGERKIPGLISLIPKSVSAHAVLQKIRATKDI